MKLVLVSDAWLPQINGVVTTLRNTVAVIESLGHSVQLVTPDGFRTIPCPGYHEIRLALKPARRVRRILDQSGLDAVHIATEGPLGMAARRWCIREGVPFATSSHTNFAEYLRLRAPIPESLTHSWLRRFHGAAQTTLVRSNTQKQRLQALGYSKLRIWPGAVDTELFQPRGKSALYFRRPISMYMGRVAVEKGLDDFLSLDLPGSKVVVGDGPDLDTLQRRYPETRFLGAHRGEMLARLVSSADVFVFPSRTDTLGLVMLEAMACGVPVAAFPVPGPQDLVIEGRNGALDRDLKSAVFRALSVPAEHCREFAQDFSWLRATEIFLSAQKPVSREAIMRESTAGRQAMPEAADVSPLAEPLLEKPPIHPA